MGEKVASWGVPLGPLRLVAEQSAANGYDSHGPSKNASGEKRGLKGVLEIRIPKPEFGDELKSYCVYSDRHFDEIEMSDEHVIPRSLGGFRSTIIKANRAFNSQIGTKIDAKIANDFMIQFARRDTNAKGASRTTPKPIIRKAATWQRGESFDDLDRRYNLEIPSSGKPKIYDAKRGVFVEFDLSKVGFISEFRISHDERARFVAKTFLGMGWRIFGSDFLAIETLSNVRDLIGVNVNNLKPCKLYYFDQFMINLEDIESHPYIKIQTIIESDVTTKMLLRRIDDFLEWTVGCLGKTVGTLIVPDVEKNLPIKIDNGSGILIEPTRHEIKYYSTDPLK